MVVRGRSRCDIKGMPVGHLLAGAPRACPVYEAAWRARDIYPADVVACNLVDAPAISAQPADVDGAVQLLLWYSSGDNHGSQVQISKQIPAH
jgi:hypothetical protein